MQLVVETQEIDPETKTYLFDLHDTYGFLFYFKNLPKPEEVDVPEGNAPENRGEKTPSQRLRAVLYVWWEQQGKQGGDFEFFYRQHMEKLIDHIKEKLT